MNRTGCVFKAGAMASVLVLSMGCLGDVEQDEQSINTTAQPIIGGVENSGDPAVVMTQTFDGLCTGTLVAPTVVLTAAHCIKGGIDAGSKSGRASFGPGNGEFTDSRNVIDLFAHRAYTAGLFSGFDIGLMRLSQPAPAGIEPIPMNPFPLDESYVGAQIRTVGFGANDGINQTGFGVKRVVQHAILGVNSERIVTGDSQRNTCQGDSGGPTFLRIDGTEYHIAVTSFGAAGCIGESEQTRTDVYLDEFINEVIAAWSGPCQGGDFQCVTEGCGDYPDPDCGPCGVDGTCSTGCDKKDLDCPMSGLIGDLCADREGCESLTCIESDDDPRVKFCSEECDPADTDACGSLTCTATADGNFCTYPGLTPSVQGAPCSEGSDCRSGVCDDTHNICIEQCGDGFPECSSEFSCLSIGNGVKACTLGSNDGCNVSGRRGGIALMLLVGLALILARKRRSGLFKTC